MLISKLESTCPTPIGVDEISSFVHTELDCLDQRRFEDWISLFTEDGYYWAPVAAEQKSPLDHVSLFYDDVRTMKLRANRLRHPRIHVQDPPSRTVHLVSNFRNFETINNDLIKFSCNFALFEFRAPQGQHIYGGTYIYGLRRTPDGLRIEEKKVLLVNSEDMFPSLSIWF